MHMGFVIGGFKGEAVFVCPEHKTRFLIFNGGTAHAAKCRGFARPFLAAFVAVKTEQKMS